MEIKDKLDLDQNGTPVDATKYRNMIGALMYLTSSRPNIVHATYLCAWYQAKPTKKHLKEVKRIFLYLWGSVNTGLWYTKDSGFELTGFSDADYAGCKDTFKSTSAGAKFLGKKLVSWSLKKQDCTALSTAEAEHVYLSAYCAQVLWMRTQLTDYGFHFKKIPIYCDSKLAIAISCNSVQHSRTKHIAVRYHFIKEHMEKEILPELTSTSFADNDLLMEEIDLSFTPDDPMPPSIEEDDYDSKRDIPILEELLDNYPLSLPENESYHFNIPPSSRPPAKPPDGNTRILNIKMMGDIFEQKVPIPWLTITRVSNQEKSPDLLSHQGLEFIQPSAECSMMINGKNTHILDVPLFYFYPP
nr:copia protein [Tanacetum cinerariifolium]